MDYLKEPFDFKLFVLSMLGKWKQFVLCTLAGAVLFGGSYYLYKVAYAPAREFRAVSAYYIQYVNDPALSDQYSYFNEATLNSWLVTDEFVNPILPKLSVELTKEELAASIQLIMASDVRVVQLQAEASKPELTMEILKAYDEAFLAFGENQREIDFIRRQDMQTEAVQIKADIRTQRAFVLGGVLGLFAGAMYLMLQYLLDDGILLPKTLQKRHGLTVFGTNISEELAANVAFAVKQKKKVAVTAVSDSPSLAEVTEVLKHISPEVEWIPVPAMVQCPEAGEVLRGCDGCVLTVVSEKDKSSAIDRALSYYEQQQVAIIGAILWDADEKLLRRYGK